MLTFALCALGGYLAHGAVRVVRHKPKGLKAIAATLVGGGGGGGPQEP